MEKQATPKIKLHFLGAAGTVTGSKYLLEFAKTKIMVDCGLFQGLKKLRELNWQYPPVNVEEILAVFLTHAHLDHTGYLPRLLKSGFNGNIYGTAPTLAITEIILRDSAKIQEEEAEKANKEGYSSHKPAKPLYTTEDVEKTLSRFVEVPLGEWVDMEGKFRIRFQYAGHILGATFIEIDIHGKRFVFSGDLGRENDHLLRLAKKPAKADVLLLESTYGNRLHPKNFIEQELLKVILETFSERGTLIIPSFAVERTQLLMYLFWKLRDKGLMPHMPVYMDSPMGSHVLDVFERFTDWHKLSPSDCSLMCGYINIIESMKETWAVIDDPNPKIVIAGSGMVTGGRVLTYLTKYLERPETRILLVGFQAEGTRGRQLLEGAHELKIYGQYYMVKAQVRELKGLSAHGDQQELLNWLDQLAGAPEHLFLVHGESLAADVLRVKIKDQYGWNVKIPDLYSIAEID